MLLYIIRHPTTKEKIENKIAGWSGGKIYKPLALPEIAMVVKRFDAETPFDRIYSCPTPRCSTLAEAIAENHDRDVIYRDDLKGFNYGKYEKRPARKYIKKVKKHGFGYSPKDGEFYPAYVERVRSSLNDIIAEGLDNDLDMVGIVTHGQNAAIMTTDLLGMKYGQKTYKRFRPGCAQISEFRICKNDNDNLLFYPYNLMDSSHLRDLNYEAA